jgi:hypothetical protein
VNCAPVCELGGTLTSAILKLSKLIVMTLDGYRAKHPFCHRQSVHGVRHGQNLCPDFWREPEHALDLGDPRAGDPFPTSDLGPAGDRAGFQQGLPFEGLPQ